MIRRTFDLGPGDTDLYEAFAWRNWQLIRDRGTAGLVLPRTVLQAKGSEHWRKEVVQGGTFEQITTLLNTGGWVFEDVHSQYLITLTSLHKTDDEDRAISLNGPFSNYIDYQARKERYNEPILTLEFLSWSDDASFPQIPNHSGALRLFRSLGYIHVLIPTQPNPTQPNPTQPNPTQPNPTQPNPTQPNPTQPNPTHQYTKDGEFARYPKCTLLRTSTGSFSTVASPPASRGRFNKRQAPLYPRHGTVFHERRYRLLAGL